MFHQLFAVQIPIYRRSRGVLLDMVGGGEVREVGKQVSVWSELWCLHTYIHMYMHTVHVRTHVPLYCIESGMVYVSSRNAHHYCSYLEIAFTLTTLQAVLIA